MGQQQKVWVAFLLLAIFWGTSFMFIKIALVTLAPLTLVALRLLVGAAGLLLVAFWRRVPLPKGAVIWRHLSVFGLLGVALPFVLITWAESGANGVSSGMASVLNSMVPLFSIIFSGLVLKAEPVTPGRIAGLLLGFGGVVLLFSQNLGGSAVASLLPPLAISLAAACYAISSAYAKQHLRGHPVAIAAGQILVADAIVWLGALTLDRGQIQTYPALTVFSVVWLGLMGSCFAYILYFYILQNWTTTQTMLVTYVVPVVGVTAGVLFLDELLDWRLVVGGILILAGVGAVNWPARAAAA